MPTIWTSLCWGWNTQRNTHTRLGHSTLLLPSFVIAFPVCSKYREDNQLSESRILIPTIVHVLNLLQTCLCDCNAPGSVAPRLFSSTPPFPPVVTAVSQLWLGGCFEKFLTFQKEPMWPDSVGWFTSCQTRVHEAQKNCVPSRKCQTVVAVLCWHYTLIFYLFIFFFLKNLGCAWHSQDWPEELWFAFTFANKQHLMWFRKDQTFWRKFENKAHRLWGINIMKNIKAKKEKIFHRNESKEGGVVAQDTPTPAKAVISKLITLVLILYLWFMELTAGLTHAFHYAWLLGMKGFCCCVFKKFLHLLSKLEFGLYKRWTLCLIEWESLFWGSKCVSFCLFLDVFHDWLCCCICSNTLTVGFLPIWIVICFITTHVLVKII